MKQTTLPRIPGRDFAGVVNAGPAEWIGAEVWGTGGDVGFTRDGTHAELLAVPTASLRRKPSTLSFDEAASVGGNYMAAWCGVEATGVSRLLKKVPGHWNRDVILFPREGARTESCGAMTNGRDRCSATSISKLGLERIIRCGRSG